MGRAVVIGGGITGVLTSRALLLDGWDVVMLEARHLGAGSSSRTVAGIRQQFSTPGTVRGMRFSRQAYEALSDELGARTMTCQGYLFLLTDATWDAAGDIPENLYRPAMRGRHVYASMYIGHPTLDMSPISPLGSLPPSTASNASRPTSPSSPSSRAPSPPQTPASAFSSAV